MNIMPLPWELLFKLFPCLPKVPPPVLATAQTDLNQIAEALMFMGVCSVICAGLWAVALVWSSKNRLKATQNRKEK